MVRFNAYNEDLKDQYPNVPQYLWEGVLTFIYRRFRAFRRQKWSHPQWDDLGQKLWDLSEKARNLPGEFVKSRVVDNQTDQTAPSGRPRD
jgi:hypothetical protein